MTVRRMAYQVLFLILLLVLFSHPVEAHHTLCFGRNVTIYGTHDADILIGTPGNDVIKAGRGADSVFAGSGNDIICAGRGGDDIDGGPGWDRIQGGRGKDDCMNAERQRNCEEER